MSVPSPSRLGPYEVRATLGRGGMGEVYLAEDTRLKRLVAIKILVVDSDADEHASRRLIREAQAAAALDHPNICSIYEVGEQDGRAFIVMQYVEGETLAARIQRQRLATSEILEITISVADGLAEAHARGIVHRDIKPQNIMITARGQGKILDFGLAKAAADADGAGVDTQSLWTQANAIVGTAPYMSPEQVKGQALDPRSDIFSFGAVLYELFSGHRPFSAQTVAETISAVLTIDPPPLSAHGVTAPPGVERVLRQCLRKDREQRYQSMREVRLELESVRRACESGAAVAPAEDAAQPLSRGATGRMAQAVATFTPRIALALGAVAVVAASYVWFVRLPPVGEPAPGSRTVSSAAYDLYLRGKVNADSENRDNNETAITLLQQAVAADPTLAPAYAHLARAYLIKAFYFAPDSEKKQLLEDAQVLVEKALRLDPNLAEAYLARGLLLWTHQNRFPHDLAAQSYKRAIALNPKLDEAHHQLALVYLHVGLLDKGWAEIEQALAANPANSMARFRFGVIDLYRGRSEDALAIFNSTPVELSPSLLTFQKAAALLQLGRIQEATALVDEYLATYSADEGGTVTSMKAMLLAKAGSARDAEKAIQHAIEIGRGFGHFHHTAYNIASAYALLNRPDEAIRWLQAAADDGFPCYPLFEQDKNLNSLRADKRFVAFLTQMKARLKQYEVTL